MRMMAPGAFLIAFEALVALSPVLLFWGDDDAEMLDRMRGLPFSALLVMRGLMIAGLAIALLGAAL